MLGDPSPEDSLLLLPFRLRKPYHSPDRRISTDLSIAQNLYLAHWVSITAPNRVLLTLILIIRRNTMTENIQSMPRESMEVDVIVVGAGPGGLATACKLMQLSNELDASLTVVVLEKGSEVGAHILSGAVIETTALDELFPDWNSSENIAETKVSRDEINFFLSKKRSLRWPAAIAPKTMRNEGNLICSLGRITKWLAKKAEELGVDIYPGFAATEVLFGNSDEVVGVATGNMGVTVDGQQKNTYQPGMELYAKYTIFAEGSRGQLGKQMIAKYELDKDCSPQHYAIGLKELWEIDNSRHDLGLVTHSVGWPLSETNSSGGSFLYHLNNNIVSLGLIVDLNYRNPYLSPFDELQRYKTHPKVSNILQGARRIGYGARAITKGGFNSLPKMSMPGAFLIGCNAGTLNFSKIKGTHTAMKSGLIAAEIVFNELHSTNTGGKDLHQYQEAFLSSWAGQELYRSRNFGPALHRFGTYIGGAFNYIDQNIARGKLPFTVYDKTVDKDSLNEIVESAKINYPKPDGATTFDRNSSVFLANVYHEEDQPVHLQLTDKTIPLDVNLPKYGEPAQRYCPAGVYEIIEDPIMRFQINAQNCIHCKTCDIKDPTGNITWVAPEGGSGPSYIDM